MKRTAKPTVAGIMNIVIGATNLLGVIGIAIAIAIIRSQTSVDTIVLTVLWIVFAGLLIFSLPSLIGGIYAIQRKNWGLALAGSIASFVTWSFIGLIPIILIVLSKDEFGAGTSKPSQHLSLELAKERYAKGEISREEFEQIKKDLP